ncbi:MAG: alpha/beta fold hydrolase [Gammaproteobacteria bacterium]|jgi:pimeloyl-ACP methyl ester carboxylesterase/DNA-binding CsgD family transcriptional regulator
MQQHVRLVHTSDQINLAWTDSGRGMPFVKAANWLTHLQYDLESPVWRHWTRFFGQHFRYIRYDERGCGMSDWQVGDLSFARWVEDLEQVVEAAQIDRPFALLGISQGAATSIAYAIRHPQRVSHLILYGGYAVGGAHESADPDRLALYKAVQDVVRLGWDRDNPAFRQLFTSRFIPGGNAEQIGWFNELCRRTTPTENASALLEARGSVDVRDLLPQVRVPTLVMHASQDQIAPLSQGKHLASRIPDARFIELDSCNHVLLEHEPAWNAFRQAVLEFTGRLTGEQAPDPGLATLTRRERAILALLCQGHSNARIGWDLGISEKTVRNHLSHLYEKLGVHSRAEAIVLSQRGRPLRDD